jgi:hypothetical protein
MKESNCNKTIALLLKKNDTVASRTTLVISENLQIASNLIDAFLHPFLSILSLRSQPSDATRGLSMLLDEGRKYTEKNGHVTPSPSQ